MLSPTHPRRRRPMPAGGIFRPATLVPHAPAQRTPDVRDARRSTWIRRAVAAAAVLALPFFSGCDAAQDTAALSSLTAAERVELARYLPEPDAAGDASDVEPDRDFALVFGRGQSAFAEPLAVIQDQTFRVALDVRPYAEDWQAERHAQNLLGSRDGLRLALLAGGALRFTTPGYIAGTVGRWTLTTPPGAVQDKRWQRVEVSYNELMLRVAVDGVVLAETDRYQESSAAGTGRAWLAPSFQGAVDRPRFTTYKGTEVYNAATFDEGQGQVARFTGLSGGKRELRRAVWTPRRSTTADQNS